MVSNSKYRYEVTGADAGCEFSAKYIFCDRALGAAGSAVRKGFRHVQVTRISDGKVIFSKT